jgi:hypothetical protein
VTDTVQRELLRGLWVARPAEFRRAENVAEFHGYIRRLYPNLLEPGGDDSDEALAKVLDGLIL